MAPPENSRLLELKDSLKAMGFSDRQIAYAIDQGKTDMQSAIECVFAMGEGKNIEAKRNFEDEEPPPPIIDWDGNAAASPSVPPSSGAAPKTMTTESKRNFAQLKTSLRPMGFSDEMIMEALEQGKTAPSTAIEYLVKVNAERQSILAEAPVTEWKPFVPESTSQTAEQVPASSQDQSYDRQMQRAIELSKLETPPKEKEQEQLQRALYESSRGTGKSQGNPSPSWYRNTEQTPDKRKRSSFSEQVGLVNIGNTCYINSLFQLYYNLPEFRRAIFGFRRKAFVASDEKNEGTEHAVAFVEQLQLLFAQMALGPEKYVDPTGAIEALRVPDGQKIEIGGQQDVSEFNHILLDIVERAFTHSQMTENGDENTAAVNPAKSLFTSQFVQEIIVDGDCSDTSTSETNSIIVDVSTTGSNDLYWGLDGYTHASVEYRRDRASNEENGQNGQHPSDIPEVQNAVKNVWFTKLAPVIMIYTSRVRYNRESGTTEKIHDYLELDDEIALDRYLEGNKAAAEKARTCVADIRKRRSDALENIEEYRHIRSKDPKLKDEMGGDSTDVAVEKTKLRLMRAIDQSSRFGVDSVSQEHLRTCLEILSRVQEEDAKKVEEWRVDAEELLRKEKQVYVHLDSVRYKLLAVLVHSGAASSGHYWTYIRSAPVASAEESAGDDTQANGGDGTEIPTDWMRFDDMQVRKATNEDVKTDSEGGVGKYHSAYGLVYVSEQVQKECKTQAISTEASSLLPSELLDQLSEYQKKFERQCIEYAGRKERENLEAEAQSVVDEAVAVLLAAKDFGSNLKLSSFVEFLLTVEPERMDLIFIQALAGAYVTKGDFVAEVVDASMPTLKKPDAESKPSLVSTVIDFTSRGSDGRSPQDFIQEGFKQARKTLAGTQLIDVREELDKQKEIYAAACRMCALLKCACDASLAGMWMRAITLWSHLLRRSYPEKSDLRAFEGVDRVSALAHLNHDEFAFSVLGVLLTIASDMNQVLLQHEVEEVASVAEAGREVQSTVSTFFARDTPVYRIVQDIWLKACMPAGNPELDKIVEGYTTAKDAVIVQDLPPLDDDARRDLDAAEERAMDLCNMVDFVKSLESSYSALKQMIPKTEVEADIIVAASVLRGHVRKDT